MCFLNALSAKQLIRMQNYMLNRQIDEAFQPWVDDTRPNRNNIQCTRSFCRQLFHVLYYPHTKYLNDSTGLRCAQTIYSLRSQAQNFTSSRLNTFPPSSFHFQLITGIPDRSANTYCAILYQTIEPIPSNRIHPTRRRSAQTAHTSCGLNLFSKEELSEEPTLAL
jgi:hypothetical protein